MEVDAGEPTRVQSLARLGAAAVPCQYIQPPETRPTKNVQHKINKNNSTSGPSPPLIDLGNGDASSIREAVGSACTGWGAFQVINHGVPVELLHRMRRVGKDFFGEFDMEMKLKYACDPNFPASEGYGSRMLVASNEAVLDWRDYFDHHTLPATRRNPDRWPHLPTNYRGTVSEYSDSIEVLARKVLCLISESLGMSSSSAIEEAVGEFYQNITISYYPPCPQPELTLGLQSHSDMGAITLLIQDEVEGLQVLKDDEWVMVPPLPEAILVLIADQTEIITNGRYRSCQHRAITNSKRARLSVATFHDPARSRKISPAFDPPKYREVVYGDFVSSWYSNGPEGKRNIDALLL